MPLSPGVVLCFGGGVLLGTVLLHMAKEVPVYSEHVMFCHARYMSCHVMSCPVLPGEGDNRPGRGPGRVQ